MRTKSSITAETLRDLMAYIPETGEFFWRVRSTGRRTDRPAGTTLNTGYRAIIIKGTPYQAHRLAWLYMTGEWPKFQVDHINKIKDDNRWENLRDVPPIINSWNRKKHRDNTSGYTGVVWHKSLKKWQVLCRSSGKQMYLGVYENVHEAGKIATEWYSENR